MSERLIQLSKDTVIPISLGLFLALVVGVWTLAYRVKEWELRLDNLEVAVGGRWSYHMEREAWSQFRLANPDVTIPDIEVIRAIFAPPVNNR